MTGTAQHGMDLKGLRKMLRANDQLFAKALERPAIQMLTWMNVGSVREPRTPPLKTGTLKGSGSAFVGSKLVGTTPNTSEAGSGGGKPTPATASNAPTPTTVHWVYNTDYAAKMHEWPRAYSALSQAAGAVDNKWMEAHIRADREAFAEFVAKDYGKGLDKLGRGL